MTLSVASVLSKVNKQITNFLFQLRWRSHIFPTVFWTFSRVNGDTSFWARPHKIANGFCFLYFCYFLDAFLKKRMTPTISKSEVKCWMEGRNWFVYWCYCYCINAAARVVTLTPKHVHITPIKTEQVIVSRILPKSLIYKYFWLRSWRNACRH